ncbi:hypothetical protein CAOG_09141 [Capsaspora owczarzaki ATCC 30864]|uniref:Uncharacterized protein n=1 Tax=Capsaspora owczarzaki (strain ATCC 30864) TaxID=595528 RepID=A0A0D2X5I6_CAPO3|nr:hypothetical protein CAOG_09141 [Capsaspora owczarzaki ATCC 30864]KJE97874.1 hypothetical protein CAOG_009141 [Capsaspora owczarzaki ATCC 30864]|eukprot:XP_011270851.1 hypothetical protein CAOG_09141 [Capsaspora owczarzaki ATCC 30864]
MVTRADGRMPNQLRELSIEHAVLSRADGSSRFSQRDTSALTAVYGPAEVKSSKELLDKATVQTVFRPKTGLAGVDDHVCEAILRQALEPVIQRTANPRTSITVIVQVMHDDGALLACALNSASMALIDAGVPMSAVLAAVTCAWLPAADGSSERRLLLDPTLEEQTAATSIATFAFESTNQEIVFSSTEGQLTVDEYFYTIEMAQKAAANVLAFMRLSLERKFSKSV